MTTPKRGDEIFIPSEHDDGHWCNAIVNAVLSDGKLMVGCTGHRFFNVVAVPPDSYGTWWCWPQDVGKKGSGGKTATLEELEG